MSEDRYVVFMTLDNYPLLDGTYAECQDYIQETVKRVKEGKCPPWTYISKNSFNIMDAQEYYSMPLIC